MDTTQHSEEIENKTIECVTKKSIKLHMTHKSFWL